MFCYLSTLSHPDLRRYIASLGYEIVLIAPIGDFEWETSAHPDSLLFALGKKLYAIPKGYSGKTYPDSAALNGLLVGRYFIHNLSLTDPKILREVQAEGYIPVDVKQGYCRCSLLKADENSLITSDRGLYGNLSKKTDLELLLCEPGNIRLDRHTGFWGGCAGRIDDRVVFHGRLSGQPDEQKIRAFIEGRGLQIREFPFPLRDIGGWVISSTLPGEESRIKWFLQGKI